MIVTVVTAVVQIWITIKIKFAPDAATIAREIKSIFRKMLFWFSNLCSLGAIIWLFASSLPVDRLFIFVVISNSFVLFHSYLVKFWLHRLPAK